MKSVNGGKLLFTKNNIGWNNFINLDNENNRIVFFGAHDFDIQVTSGAAILALIEMGFESFIINFTLGEKVANEISSEEYILVKKRDSEKSAELLNVKIKNLSYKDAELYYNNKLVMEIIDEIRALKPQVVVTHWKESMHKDHMVVHKVVSEAVFLSELNNIKTSYPAHKVENVLFTENWEDNYNFMPNVYVDTEKQMEKWESAVSGYDFLNKSLSMFPYIDYYKSLARLRGIEAGFKYAQCFRIEEDPKIRIFKS